MIQRLLILYHQNVMMYDYW